MTANYKGSCLCKTIHFEIDGDFDNFYFCHCDRCRKDSGSAHAANLFSSTAKLKWISGQENIQTFILPSTQHIKSFCITCGSAMPNILNGGKLLMVPAGALDGVYALKPTAHINLSDKARWDEDLENVPKFEEFPG
ncbi:MAG: GFA family protein [Candidatus Nitronauta litoralis]|uniref:GFA family protein n=1 Tax=Candidatus Nitronauta litoralis TaxID=2705533 RepID=A0A7T0FZR6_9BACT|nr:MAG: GFA family protein [Candidatus Nitronauta litoralis]